MWARSLSASTLLLAACTHGALESRVARYCRELENVTPGEAARLPAGESWTDYYDKLVFCVDVRAVDERERDARQDEAHVLLDRLMSSSSEQRQEHVARLQQLVREINGWPLQ